MVDADANLLAIFEVNQIAASVQLLGLFHSGQDSAELLGGLTSRQAASVELLGEVILRRSALVELPAEFVIRRDGIPIEIPAELISRQAGFADFLNTVILRHDGIPLNFLARFAIRLAYPYWTNRRLINGVITNAENLMGDAILETVMEGVMDDIRVWCDANDVSYTTWLNLDTVPRAMMRATTYGVVAALYARYSKTFQGRVVPTLAPVTVTVVGDDEKAMQHWQDKMHEMLELYLSAQDADRIWVSTADEEPVFTMRDIPDSGAADRELLDWQEWLDIQRVG